MHAGSQPFTGVCSPGGWAVKQERPFSIVSIETPSMAVPISIVSLRRASVRTVCVANRVLMVCCTRPGCRRSTGACYHRGGGRYAYRTRTPRLHRPAPAGAPPAHRGAMPPMVAMLPPSLGGVPRRPGRALPGVALLLLPELVGHRRQLLRQHLELLRVECARRRHHRRRDRGADMHGRLHGHAAVQLIHPLKSFASAAVLRATDSTSPATR